MTFTVPIFHDGELVAFSCCMAHWPDVGGTLMEGTTDIFSEGLQMPIVKIYRKGVPNEELISIIKNNVRLPERAMGDFRAQIAAVKTGERRFMDMIRKYGRDAVLGGIAAIMDQSEAVARARVRAIPDGVYEAESFMDDDGINVGQRVPINVRVTVAGDRMTVDLSEVSKQVQGFYNSGITAGRSCCQVAFKCLTSALDLPINDGEFRALDIVLPPGRVVSAVKPAAMRMWMTYPMTIVDTIFKALAPALPNQVIAGHHADLVRRPHQRPPAEGRQLLHLSRRPDRRRLGRQARQRRPQRRDRDERRRHPQRPVRAGRGEVSAAGRALLPAAGFRRRRPLPRRPRHRAGGAGAPPDPLQLADGPRQVQAVGP